MEELRDTGEDDSGPLPSPPLLHAHRTTHFFIDDILRPDFGRKREQAPGARASERGARGPGARPTDSSTACADSSCSSDSVSSPASSPSSSAPCGGVSPSPGPAESSSPGKDAQQLLWPAWVYCTRYSDRPSSGPRTRKLKKKKNDSEDKRPRTAFTAEQLQTLKAEFQAGRYITEQRRRALARDLRLNESQIKIWFQNKRAKIKKACGPQTGLAAQLMAQGLYNHSTTTVQERDND